MGCCWVLEHECKWLGLFAVTKVKRTAKPLYGLMPVHCQLQWGRLFFQVYVDARPL